jgi:transposase InsO family protein
MSWDYWPSISFPVGTTISYIEPGSPWENAYVESFNRRVRDELLNIEEFGSRHCCIGPARRLPVRGGVRNRRFAPTEIGRSDRFAHLIGAALR